MMHGNMNIKKVRVANMPAVCFHPSSSEPVVKGHNSSIKMVDYKRSKFQTLLLMNIETLL